MRCIIKVLASVSPRDIFSVQILCVLAAKGKEHVDELVYLKTQKTYSDLISRKTNIMNKGDFFNKKQIIATTTMIFLSKTKFILLCSFFYLFRPWNIPHAKTKLQRTYKNVIALMMKIPIPA